MWISNLSKRFLFDEAYEICKTGFIEEICSRLNPFDLTSMVMLSGNNIYNKVCSRIFDWIKL